MTTASWTRNELLSTLHLYTQLPFGQLHARNPRILQLASWLGRTPGSVAMKLVNLASLDPLITASGRSGLKGASKLDRAVWAEQAENWDAVAAEAARAYEQLAQARGLSVEQAEGFDEAELVGCDEKSTPAEEGRSRQAWVSVRLDQARFRRAVLASYGQRCCISGLSEPRLLIASHIVPWAQDERNRLNPHNGLCLSALHDRAFDQGLITITPGSLRVRVSERLRATLRDPFGLRALVELDGQPIRLPQRYRPSDVFLDWHGRRFGFGRQPASSSQFSTISPG